jgi:glucose-6-phosphate 1-epimerase
VVWNPFTTMESCYKEFACVESAKIKPVTLQAGEDWRATTVMDVIDL